MNCCFGLLYTLIKKLSGTSFWSTFSVHDFSIKHSMSFNTIPFYDLKISKKKCVINFLFRQLIMSLTLRIIFNHLLTNGQQGKKLKRAGRDNAWNTKI